MPPTPHDSWADVYDFVQRASFGALLDDLSALTLAMIERLQPSPGRLLDVGAGTGRLAIPLARGHDVCAVEPSGEMLTRLRAKADAAGVTVSTQRATGQTFAPVPGTDLAFAVFTVMNYLLDEDAVRSLIERVRASLAPGGSFLFDLAGAGLFYDAVYRAEGMTRAVTIAPLGGDRFRYEERCEGEHAGRPFAYRDRFEIRCWRPEQVLDLMAREGLVLVEDHSEEMAGSYSHYLRVRIAP